MCDPIPRLTRREVFRLGGLTVSGFRLLPFAAPANVRAQAHVTPRGSASCVIFLNLQGGPPQMDTFDVKEGKWAPQNRDVRATPYGYQFPHGLMPRLSEHLGDLLLLRSMEAWETVHSRGQYYLQTGHAVSPARMHETPSMGSVIAYEFHGRRREGDFLPPYVAMNYEPTTMYGPLQGEGCLPGDCAPLTMDLRDRSLPFIVEDKDQARFGRRWELLNRLDAGSRAPDETAPQPVRQYAAFRNAVHQMMDNPAIGKVLALREEERKTYGSSPLGDACLIARNMVAADAGVRFIFITHPGWDLHVYLYGKRGQAPAVFRSLQEALIYNGGLYKLCAELDTAFSALLADLKTIQRKDGTRLIDHTFVACLGEFGRTPGDLTSQMGREHYAKAMVAAFAGAGVKGGRAVGATDEQAAGVKDYGWSGKRPIYMEDVCATIYSTLGIDWTKRITHTPSGRDFVYVDPAAGQTVIDFREVADLFG